MKFIYVVLCCGLFLKVVFAFFCLLSQSILFEVVFPVHHNSVVPVCQIFSSLLLFSRSLTDWIVCAFVGIASFLQMKKKTTITCFLFICLAIEL